MQLIIPDGKHVLAISGGVDSVAMLDIIASGYAERKKDFIVAHFDHGIRSDSSVDRQLVQELAQKYGIRFVYDKGNLSAESSEEQARDARYAFLRQVLEYSGSRSIVTAHHQDDLIETAIHNILRGTNRMGLISLRTKTGLLRPMLGFSKSQIIEYAKDNNLVWREDSTNTDLRYRRNYIRHKIANKITDEQKKNLLGLIADLTSLDEEIGIHVSNYLHMQPALSELDRHWFIMLPHNISREVMATFLRRHNVLQFGSGTIERLLNGAKTGANGTILDVDKLNQLKINKDTIKIQTRVL